MPHPPNQSRDRQGASGPHAPDQSRDRQGASGPHRPDQSRDRQGASGPHRPDQSRDRQGAPGSPAGMDRQRTPATTEPSTPFENPPLAYFLTFTTYGTWLHGDDRGSVDRSNNTWDTGALPPNLGRHEYVSQFRLKAPPFRLDGIARPIVADAIRYVCERRDWELRAVNVRTNHVHAVVSGSERPEGILTALKAWSTRRLTEAGVTPRGRPVWTRHGSTRYAWTQSDVDRMCWYVVDGQGPPLAGLPPPQPAGRSLSVAALIPGELPPEGF